MQYQITYFSPAGHAEKLARAFLGILPPNTSLASPGSDSTPEADVHLVGFDFQNTEPKQVPREVRTFLQTLTGKTILLFATVPFQLNDVLERGISDLMVASLPRECDYLGAYVCAAQPPETLLQHFQTAAIHQPGNSRARYWQARCEQAIGRPNESDIQKGCSFVTRVLK